MDNIQRIASFAVDHTTLLPGIYVSRVDGDVTTYDLRTRVPNSDDLMDNGTMHSLEHMLATFLRNSSIAADVLYFGPMGCQTGFYLLVRNADHQRVLAAVKEALKKTIAHEGDVFGNSAVECGNYINLDVDQAKKQCAYYSQVIHAWSVEKLAY